MGDLLVDTEELDGSVFDETESVPSLDDVLANEELGIHEEELAEEYDENAVAEDLVNAGIEAAERDTLEAEVPEIVEDEEL